MDPKELKENFQTQLDTAQKELNNLRQAVAQREALVLKLQGAVEAMDLQLSQPSSEEVFGGEEAVEGSEIEDNE